MGKHNFMYRKAQGNIVTVWMDCRVKADLREVWGFQKLKTVSVGPVKDINYISESCTRLLFEWLKPQFDTRFNCHERLIFI